MAEPELNVDSLIQRLLEGKDSEYYEYLYFAMRSTSCFHLSYLLHVEIPKISFLHSHTVNYLLIVLFFYFIEL